ncbi:MAG: hypothetical protein HKN72_10260 [Gemmatimonadetes bacterium]|nr:hypothetical protein [Gemmatimonadota bacterium]
MIDRIVELTTGARSAVAAAALALGGTALFRLSPYDALKARLNGASLPEETITPPHRLAEVLEALGAAGRASYLQFQVWDLLNPILMGVAGALLLGWLLKRGRRATSVWRWVVVFPVVLLMADLLENLVISVAVSAFPDRVALSSGLPLVTAAKFGAAIATMVAVVVLALLWLRDRLSGRDVATHHVRGGQ